MTFTARLLLLLTFPRLLVACDATVMHGQSPGLPDGPDAAFDAENTFDGAQPSDAASTLVALDPTQGRYRATCDGSAAIVLDFTSFLAFSDNDQRARVYKRGATAPADQLIDVSANLGMAPADEADLEDAVRIENRIYVLGSHGRKNDGSIDVHRYQFAAFDVAGGSPNLTLTAAGRSVLLLQDMLVATNWSAPDTTVITALRDASRLDQPVDVNLAPKRQGTNLEGLARAPTAATPERLVIGLRNPQINARAIVVTLMNPSAVVGGAPARFGEAIQLDLGGLGIRGMTWSATLESVLILAGPHDGTDGPYRLYRWSGAAGAVPMLATQIIAPVAGGHPEAILAYPTTKDVQILFDSDDVATGATSCDNAAETVREFRDLIVHQN